VTSLSFNGNQAHMTGTRKIGKVGVTDNGKPGTTDFFSIQFSNGYSGSGYPLN
jgi:hypothetical protein